jgi:hypothetical protein
VEQLSGRDETARSCLVPGRRTVSEKIGIYRRRGCRAVPRRQQELRELEEVARLGVCWHKLDEGVPLLSARTHRALAVLRRARRLMGVLPRRLPGSRLVRTTTRLARHRMGLRIDGRTRQMLGGVAAAERGASQHCEDQRESQPNASHDKHLRPHESSGIMGRKGLRPIDSHYPRAKPKINRAFPGDEKERVQWQSPHVLPNCYVRHSWTWMPQNAGTSATNVSVRGRYSRSGLCADGHGISHQETRSCVSPQWPGFCWPG